MSLFDHVRFKTINGEHWEKLAACSDADPVLFEQLTTREVGIAGGGVSQDHWDARRIERVVEALDHCAVCPVWKECVVTRANLTDQLEPISGVYGRQYVKVDVARARKARAIAREKRLGERRRIERVRVIKRTRTAKVQPIASGTITSGTLRRLGRSA